MANNNMNNGNVSDKVDDRKISVPEGYVLVGVESQSLWSGGGWGANVVCVLSGEVPVIESPGNLYDGPRTWDIVRHGDVGEIRFGLRTKSIERMLAWLRRRTNDDMGSIPDAWFIDDIEIAIDNRRE